ncbi:E3 ubiquitin-protein ligase SIAH1A [Leptinotarsa decemlineata]|uniref:E3 ubiquitin-protein ligase SIAH1A n=1 Tax=Leptinotarsa decemlineata TaxID=7539 RepID=UPI000C2555F3|nr:E3 ubiquitin-protein ligase SIAH1-like [Leptinotarsa decemlineata]
MSVKNQQADKLMLCPICVETMTSPIIQCQRGHSMCGECIKSSGITMCPCCRGPISNTRNYQLEQLIEGIKDVLKLKCCYADKGCKYIISTQEKEAHELECRFRKYYCEGKKFAKWKCNWAGEYSEIYNHFKDAHNPQTFMQYSTEANMKIDLTRDFYDLQIISFFNGQNYFFYKHKIDTAKQKAYWTFQMIGLLDQALHYFYEFEIHSGPVRQYKVIELCQNDTADTEAIFNQEKCVVITFSTLKNYLNGDGELPFKFRIKSIKKSTDTTPKKPIKCHGPRR